MPHRVASAGQSRQIHTATENSLVAWFDEIAEDASAIAGGKGASLSRIAAAGLPVPPGFVVCSAAFSIFLESCEGTDFIRRLTGSLNVNHQPSLDRAAERLRSLIVSTPLPPAIAEAIRRAYLEFGDNALVAVRSSAVSEDGETASFAGQQETFLNIRGVDQVVHHVRECWASLFSPRALFYRAQKDALADTRMAVVVQEMALGEKSGVMFTADPVQNRRDHIVIEAVLGLGEALVSGEVTPHHYVIERDDGSLVREFIPQEQGAARILTPAELNGLRKMGLRLEEFFGRPQDVEWCIRGQELLLLQSRPITTL